MERIRLGAVGAGGRLRTILGALYRVRDREYLGTSDHAGDAYAAHAGDPPDWLDPVTDLDPSVTALCDPDGEQLSRTAARCRDHGDDPATFETFEAFRRAGAYDAVLVTTPNDSHVAPVEALLADDTDLLVEKPLATTLPGHDRIAEAAARSAATLYPAFNLRSSPYFARLRELVAEGAVGDPGMVSCQEVRAPFGDIDWMYEQERSGGTFLTKNCHDFDLFNWYVDSDPVRVAAAGGQHVLDRDTDVFDHGSVVVEYASGALGTLELCMYAPWDVRTRRYELRGDAGLLRSPEAETTVDHYTREGRDRLRVATTGAHQGADLVQAARFLRCVRGEVDPPATVKDAKAAAAVGVDAERAARSGEPVGITGDYDVRE
ncbi:MAG: Gfo/Idh/MocA family protein [Halobacteriaceae archaeon]